MTIVRPTAKLRKEMGVRPAELVETTSESPFGDWYANLFFVNRRKCVLFVSERTLLCVLAVDVKRDAIRRLGELLRDGLFRVLLEEGFSANEAEPLLAECDDIALAAGKDRSMTGTLTELTHDAHYQLEECGGTELAELSAITARLNRTPMSRNDYKYAIDSTRKVLAMNYHSIDD